MGAFGAIIFFVLACVLCVVVSTTEVEVKVNPDAVLARTTNRLTSVTIDTCALKQGLAFTDPLLIKLASHLAPTVLRVGGTDQNNFGYNMSDKGQMAKCDCGHPCTMTAPYWDGLNTFLNATGLQLLYGLSPQSSASASQFVEYSASMNYKNIFAYSWGNEAVGNAVLAQKYKTDMSAVRDSLLKAYPDGSSIARPMLVGSDTGVGPRRDTVPSNMSADTYIIQHLQWIELFTKTCGSVIDAVSWHTYDYRSTDLGGEDHSPIPLPLPDQFSRFWSPEYHNVVNILAENVTDIIKATAPHLSDDIWLTETDSVCHQGVFNVTNRFANSLWLLDRFGIMASRGTKLMGRQSLIGFNYSLLGNFPVEPIKPTPDYFTTLIFRNLTAEIVLPVSVGSTDGASKSCKSYSFCHPADGITFMFINLSPETECSISVTSSSPLGPPEDYVLSPDWEERDSNASPSLRTTSGTMSLNGFPLQIGPSGNIPDFVGRSGRNGPLALQPLNAAFVRYRNAVSKVC